MRAIIPAAGHGTRFLPVTRVVPKEMLPIGSKPALELIVEEAKSAGADQIVLVISHEKELIREYFKDDPSIHFVYQEEQKGLGHAVLQGMDVEGFPQGHRDAESEKILILLGDCLVAGCNAAKSMVEVSAANGGASVIGLERVPREKVSRYGIVKVCGVDKGVDATGCGAAGRIVDMVEKPTPEEAPSDLAIAGRYLLDVRIFDYLKTQKPGKGGEIQLTDAIRRMFISPTSNLRHSTLIGYVYPGRRQDIGNPKGYFEALKQMGANE